MLSSTTLSWALTAVFAVTGAAALGRLAAPWARPVGRTAEVSHLLMSVAMIAMVWGTPGGAGATVQVVVFVLFAAFFLSSVVRPAPGHGRVGDTCHLLTTVAMVWMVAAAPVLMTRMTGMTGTTAMGAMAGPAAAVPRWVVVVDVVLVVLLLLVAARWAARARRPVPAGAGRTGALCHLLMSLGMSVMLLAPL